MISNYLKIALRNLWKQKLFAGFNILGISMGIACSIVVYLLIQHQFSQEAFHVNAPTVFMVNHVKTTNGEPELWATSPDAIGPALKADLPQVKRFVRVASVGAVVKRGGDAFTETVRLADPDFFQLFSFPLKAGQVGSFTDPSGVVLSEAMARKYFGESPAVGQSLTLLIDSKVKRTFTVTGVAAPFPNTASFTFDLLVGYGVGRELGWLANDWSRAIQATFIQVNKPGDEAGVTAALGQYVKRYNARNSQAPINAFYLDNLTDISLNAHKTRRSFGNGTSPTGLIVLGVLAGLVLFMACFNFMNYTIATSTTRFKEIGVRKVLGSSRKQLVRQFIGENLVVGIIALGLGLFLAGTLFLPAFSRLIDFDQLQFNLVDNWPLIGFLFALVLFISLLSGVYPSIYISSFNPVSVLKGKQRIAGANGLVRTLLVVQFGLSMFTVAAAILTTRNAQFMRYMDVGYNPSQLVVLRTDSESSFNHLRDVAASLPNVTEVAGSQDQIGRSGDNLTTLEEGTNRSTAEVLRISHDYIHTLGLRLKQGRNFLANSSVDAGNAIIVNQSLVKAMGWTSPVGKQVRVQDQLCRVVGVVDDFNYRFFFIKIAPCILRLNRPEDNRILTMKVAAKDIDQLTDRLKPEWQRVMPDVPFELSQQQDVYSGSYDESRRIKDVFTYVAMLTLMISAMGLFALVSLNIAKKTKEIGIRKVLGASAFSIANLLNREFLILIMLAGCIFLPLAFWVLSELLESVYAYHIPVTAGSFVGTLGLMLVLAVVTIGSQVYRIATANPIKALQTE
ncbi:ABC transporter permease [uncultured Fibrella sp.]|uniref:ABC transporter permease n=1 Tax=uncultured Fibrella sp. TaxID=1284596 RepID=UPI0035CA2519